MAVPNLPFYLSQANTEFKGNGWASNILANAKLPAPRMLSSLAGRSNWTNTLLIGKTQYDVWGYVGNGGYRMGELTPRDIANIGYCAGLYIEPEWFTVGGALRLQCPNVGAITIEIEGVMGATPMTFDASLGVYLSATVSQSILDWFKGSVGRSVGVRILRG